jgi:hypothetical protein
MKIKFKVKCFICQKRDIKENMEIGYHGIYNDNKHYFHLKCIESVICDPETYGHRTVDRALWCLEQYTERQKEQKQKQKQRRERIESAQEKLECLK